MVSYQVLIDDRDVENADMYRLHKTLAIKYARALLKSNLASILDFCSMINFHAPISTALWAASPICSDSAVRFQWSKPWNQQKQHSTAKLPTIKRNKEKKLNNLRPLLLSWPNDPKLLESPLRSRSNHHANDWHPLGAKSIRYQNQHQDSPRYNDSNHGIPIPWKWKWMICWCVVSSLSCCIIEIGRLQFLKL